MTTEEASDSQDQDAAAGAGDEADGQTFLLARFRRRSSLFLFAFIVWGIILAGRLFHIMVVNRDSYLHRVEAVSKRVGKVPALRGRILHPNGTALAWSVRSYTLTYKVPSDQAALARELKLIAQFVAFDRERIRTTPGDWVTIKSGIPAPDIIKLEPLLRIHQRLRLRTVFQRRYADMPPKVRQRLGQVVLRDHQENGVSGWEQAFNDRLSGRPGEYEVMTDKKSNWIPDTWREIKAPETGYDVQLDMSQLE